AVGGQGGPRRGGVVFAGGAGAWEGVAADRGEGEEGGVGGVGCGERGEAGGLHQLKFRAAPVDIGEGAPEAAGRADGEPDDDGGGGRRGGDGAGRHGEGAEGDEGGGEEGGGGGGGEGKRQRGGLEPRVERSARPAVAT